LPEAALLGTVAGKRKSSIREQPLQDRGFAVLVGLVACRGGRGVAFGIRPGTPKLDLLFIFFFWFSLGLGVGLGVGLASVLPLLASAAGGGIGALLNKEPLSESAASKGRKVEG
jgi:hypothetical protein